MKSYTFLKVFCFFSVLSPSVRFNFDPVFAQVYVSRRAVGFTYLRVLPEGLRDPRGVLVRLLQVGGFCEMVALRLQYPPYTKYSKMR